jgi:hypothetical protein
LVCRKLKKFNHVSLKGNNMTINYFAVIDDFDDGKMYENIFFFGVVRVN